MMAPYKPASRILTTTLIMEHTFVTAGGRRRKRKSGEKF